MNSFMFYDRNFTYVYNKDNEYVFSYKLKNIYFDNRILKINMDENKKILGIKIIDFLPNNAKSVVTVDRLENNYFDIKSYSNLYEEIIIDDEFHYKDMNVKCHTMIDENMNKDFFEVELRKNGSKKIIKLLQDKQLNYIYFDAKELREKADHISIDSLDNFRIISKSIQWIDVFSNFAVNAFKNLQSQIDEVDIDEMKLERKNS